MSMTPEESVSVGEVSIAATTDSSSASSPVHSSQRVSMAHELHRTIDQLKRDAVDALVGATAEDAAGTRKRSTRARTHARDEEADAPHKVARTTVAHTAASDVQSDEAAEEEPDEQHQQEEEEEAEHQPAGAAPRERRLKTLSQLVALKNFYAVHPRVTKEQVRKLISSTGLTHREVTRWFRNERHKEKKLKTQAMLLGTSAFLTPETTPIQYDQEEAAPANERKQIRSLAAFAVVEKPAQPLPSLAGFKMPVATPSTSLGAFHRPMPSSFPSAHPLMTTSPYHNPMMYPSPQQSFNGYPPMMMMTPPYGMPMQSSSMTMPMQAQQYQQQQQQHLAHLQSSASIPMSHPPQSAQPYQPQQPMAFPGAHSSPYFPPSYFPNYPYSAFGPVSATGGASQMPTHAATPSMPFPLTQAPQQYPQQLQHQHPLQQQPQPQHPHPLHPIALPLQFPQQLAKPADATIAAVA